MDHNMMTSVASAAMTGASNMANMMPTVTGSNVMASGTAMPSGGGKSMGDSMSMGGGCKISVGLILKTQLDSLLILPDAVELVHR